MMIITCVWSGSDLMPLKLYAQPKQLQKVAGRLLMSCHIRSRFGAVTRHYLAESLIQALAVELIPAAVKGLRVELDLGL